MTLKDRLPGFGELDLITGKKPVKKEEVEEQEDEVQPEDEEPPKGTIVKPTLIDKFGSIFRTRRF